jgi:hypothetical protein
VTNNRYALWFRRAVFLGILQDWLFAIPGIFVPNVVLGLIAEPAAQPVWPAFAMQLLLLLSLFYIPGALDPFSHRASAILTVVARGAGVVFFLVIWRGHAPAWIGYLDLTFSVIQGVLLWLTYRQGQAAVALSHGQQATA